MLAKEAIQAQHSALCTAYDKVWQGLWTDTVPSGQRGERSGRGGPLERSNGRPRWALAKPPIGGTPNGLKSRSQPLQRSPPLWPLTNAQDSSWTCRYAVDAAILSAHSSPLLLLHEATVRRTPSCRRYSLCLPAHGSA